MHDILSKYTGSDIQSITKGADIQSITRMDIQSITRMDIQSMTKAEVFSMVQRDPGAQEILALEGAFSKCNISDNWKEEKRRAILEHEGLS